MIIKPKIRGFICTTAHPTGCARHTQEQIDYVKSQSAVEGPKKVLVLGGSQGFGLASRIVSSFGAGADTLGVFFERPAADDRTATAGWYNSAAFEKAAREAGYFARSINGDAFSDELKTESIELIRQHFGKVDLIIYSIASPRRTDPRSGETFNSVLKPVGQSYTNRTVNVQNGVVSDVTIEPCTDEEIRQTVAVMGGEDWERWIDALEQAEVLAEGVTTVAFSYIGPEITHSIYREGTIGKAKEHLEATAKQLDSRLKAIGGRAFVSVNKALVTQASAAIPVVPLYISLLYKVMKEKDVHEGCIEQMYRLFNEQLYSGAEPQLDDKGRIRIDNLEMRDDVQQAVAALWEQVSTDNLAQISDIESYRSEFLKLFGFGYEEIDYNEDVNPNVQL